MTKTLKALLLSIAPLQFLVLSCSHQTNFYPPIVAEKSSSGGSINGTHVSPEPVSIQVVEQHLKESLDTLLKKEVGLEGVRERIIQHTNFLKLVQTCETYSPYKTKFLKPYKVSSEKYILQMQCTIGAYQSEDAYFLVHRSRGDLQLLTTEVFMNAQSKVVRSTVVGTSQYRTDSKLLISNYRCDGQYSCSSRAVYEFINDRFKLKEFFIGHKTDGRPIEYRQVYPKKY